MTKREEKIVDLAVTAMKSIIRMARKPIITRRGNMLIDGFRDAVKAIPSGKKPKDSE